MKTCREWRGEAEMGENDMRLPRVAYPHLICTLLCNEKKHNQDAFNERFPVSSRTRRVEADVDVNC